MTVQINIADEVSITVNKAGQTFSVVTERLPDASLAHIFNYGLRQILNDAAAGTEAGADSAAAVRKRLDNLLAGTLRASTGRTADPVLRRAKEIAAAAVDAAIRKAGKKPSAVKNRTDLISAHAAKPAVIAQAKIDVEAANELDLDIDI